MIHIRSRARLLASRGLALGILAATICTAAAVAGVPGGDGGPRGAGPCGDDFNGDGRVTAQDLYDYITAWYTGNMSADSDGDGVIEVQDIYDFIQVLLSGCP